MGITTEKKGDEKEGHDGDMNDEYVFEFLRNNGDMLLILQHVSCIVQNDKIEFDNFLHQLFSKSRGVKNNQLFFYCVCVCVFAVDLENEF